MAITTKRVKRYVRKQAKGYLKGKDAWAVAKQALQGVYYLKGLVNAEKKFLDLSGTSQSCDYNGSIHHLTAIASSATEGGRDGNSIYVRSVNLKLSLYLNGQTNNNVRVILFIDKDPTVATAPTGSLLLEGAGGYTATVSPLKFPESRYRFKILSDKTHVIDSNNTKTNISIYKTLRHHVRYTGINSNDYGKGQIYVAVFSDSVTTNLPGYYYYNRITYYDN